MDISKECMRTEKENRDTCKKNILITNVSFLSIDKNTNMPTEREYKDEEGHSFKGEMTNEAPIKSLSARLGQIDAIIFIESTTVSTKKYSVNDKEYTSIDYLKKKIAEINERGIVEFIDVNITDEPQKTDVAKTVFEIYDKLVEFARSGDEINIYIESNGGIRYVLTMLLSLAKTLEKIYDNVHILEITSMVLNQNPVNIKNTKDIFDTAQITEIASEFINYGRISSLKRYMQSSLKLSDQENSNEDAKNILLLLEKISDDIQLCRTSNILEDFYGKNNLKELIEKFNDTHKNVEDFEITIFKHITNLILDDLSKIIYNDNIDKKQPICNLVYTIEWCLEKSFIQQALTFCSERLPEYLFAKEIIRLGTDFQNKLSNTSVGNYEPNYYFIAHLAEFTGIIRKKLIDKESVNFNEKSDQYSYSEVRNFINSFKAGSFNNISEVNHWLNQNFKEYKDLTVKISNKICNNPVNYTLLVQSYSEEGNVSKHKNLERIEDRIDKILPVLIEYEIDKSLKPEYDKAAKKYEEIISNLFERDSSLIVSLKEKYSVTQSKKFYIGAALKDSTRYISSDAPDKLQEILYIYSMCKEQRNLSNHAHVSEQDVNVALGASSIKILIKRLIELCSAADK